MDPLTATLNLLTAICNVVMVAMEGQTPEQRAQLWQWYIEDTTELRSRVRALLKKEAS